MVVGILLKQEVENARILQEARKVMNQQSTFLEKKLCVKKEDLTKETKIKKAENPQHNSLQHDSTVSVPLLTLLVDALKKEKKENADNETNKLEIITDDSEIDSKKESKDAIIALADRIKRLYANELMEQAYAAVQGNYSTSSHYQQEGEIQASSVYKPTYQQAEESTAKKNEELEKKRNETSMYSKLSGGDKPMAFIMSDPRGRLHSTWEIVRVLNETADGKIERNDGLHYQGLS